MTNYYITRVKGKNIYKHWLENYVYVSPEYKMLLWYIYCICFVVYYDSITELWNNFYSGRFLNPLSIKAQRVVDSKFMWQEYN